MFEQSIIAVGVDSTESSRRALAWAAHEAVRRGCTLHVITAWNWEATESAPLAAVDPQILIETAERIQDEAVAEVLGTLPVPPPTTRQIVQGTPTEALIDASHHADLVVVGTHGRGPVRSFLLGSVSLSVIKHAACPVVVMPPVREVTSGGPELLATSR
jgi:nucleotide-binding universal stress UspA family protein